MKGIRSLLSLSPSGSSSSSPASLVSVLSLAIYGSMCDADIITLAARPQKGKRKHKQRRGEARALFEMYSLINLWKVV